ALRMLMLVSASRPSVSGRFVSRLKYLIVCGRVSSSSVKSSLVRLVTICPFLSRTVTGSVTTFTSTESVVAGAATFGASGVTVCARTGNGMSKLTRIGRRWNIDRKQSIVGVILLDDKVRQQLKLVSSC